MALHVFRDHYFCDLICIFSLNVLARTDRYPHVFASDEEELYTDDTDGQNVFENFASVSPRYSQMLDESQHMTTFDLSDHQIAKAHSLEHDKDQVSPSISLLGNRRISEVMQGELDIECSSSTTSSSVPEEVDEDNEDNVVTRIDEVVSVHMYYYYYFINTCIKPTQHS